MQKIKELTVENTTVDVNIGSIWTSSAQGFSIYLVPTHDQSIMGVNIRCKQSYYCYQLLLNLVKYKIEINNGIPVSII